MTSWKFDFGDGSPEDGYQAVKPLTHFSFDRGFGWILSHRLQTRDRNADNRIIGRFVCGTTPATFRVVVDPGRYLLQIAMGDKDYGSHVLQLRLADTNQVFPSLTAKAGEYAVLRASVDVPTSLIDLTFTSPVDDWIVNSIELRPDDRTGGIEREIVHLEFGELSGDRAEGSGGFTAVRTASGTRFVVSLLLDLGRKIVGR